MKMCFLIRPSTAVVNYYAKVLLSVGEKLLQVGTTEGAAVDGLRVGTKVQEVLLLMDYELELQKVLQLMVYALVLK